jgi:general secretion pathway protein J
MMTRRTDSRRFMTPGYRDAVAQRSRLSSVSPLHRVTVSLSSSGGFTLLELIISITLIGIIVLIIAGASRLGFRSVDSGERKVESLERIRSSLSIMDSQIQSEIPLTYDEDGSRKFYFKGSRDFLRFPTNYSLSGAERGYVMASYRVVPGERGGQVLFLSENGIGMENSTETKLLEAFNEISFEYYYKDPTEEQGSWVHQWTDETTTPEKLRVHLVQGSKDLVLIIPMRSKGSLTQAPVPAQGVPQGTPARPSFTPARTPVK